MYFPRIRICNNNCISCFDNKAAVVPENTLDEIVKFIKNRDEIETVVLTCGEATMRPDFFELIEAILKQGKKIDLLSNGRKFSNKIFTKKLLKYDKNRINILVSLYGHNAKLHDRITRVVGSFNETYQGIKNLEKFKFNPEIRTLVNKINYREFPKLGLFIKNNFKHIKSVTITFLALFGNAAWNRHDVHVSYSDSVPYVEKTIEILKKYFDVSLLQFPKCVLNSDYRKFACGYSSNNKYWVEYFKKCDKCSERNNCSGVWVNYKLMEGDKELSPI